VVDGSKTSTGARLTIYTSSRSLQGRWKVV